jgi:hypothetical protein
MVNLIPNLQFCLVLHGFTVPDFRALRTALGSFQAFFEKELCQLFPRAECEGALVAQSSRSVVSDHATRTRGYRMHHVASISPLVKILHIT